MRYLRLLMLSIILSCLTGCTDHIMEVQGARSPEFSQLAETQNVIFIHGMYLTPKSWIEWENYFVAQGFQTHAPAWPHHTGSVEEINALHPNPELAQLSLNQLLDHYREIIENLEQSPVLIGHSMGGLIVQKLLSEGLGAGGIAINSAPPQGVISIDPNFLKANWPHINPLLSDSQPTRLKLREFSFGFMNGFTEEEQIEAYNEYIVPESRRVGKAPLSSQGAIDYSYSRRPLLMISGGKDHITPESLNYSNFVKYMDTQAITDYKQFPERTHWTLQQSEWETVADYILNWIDANIESDTEV